MSSDGLEDLEVRAAKIVKAVQRLDKRIQNKGRLLRYVRSEMAALQKKKDKHQDCTEDGALSAMECSNLPYYQAIVEMCHAVVACGVLRRFSADDAQVTFEVTAGLATGAVAWIKCFARSQHRLEHDHILDLAKSCLHIAKMNIIGDATPRVCFRFFAGLPPSLAAAVAELGIDVAEGAVPPQDPSRTTADSINLDTTTLIALTSNLSHGQVGWTFKDAELEKQAAMEAEEPVLRQLASILGGRRLVVSSTALETYKELIEKMAGGYERKRADEIVAALTVAEAERPDGFLTSRKVSEDMLKVIGVGLKHGIPTCMANTKAMRSIQDQRQGVHILQHMPRALTEGAQSKKTSKRNDRRHPIQAEELQKLFDYILGVGDSPGGAPVVESTDPADSLSEAVDAQEDGEDGADASGSELNDPRSLDAGPPLDLTSVCACILADETFREKCTQCLGELKQACKDAFSGPEFQMKPFDWCPEPVLTAFGSTVQGTAIKTSDLDVRLSFEQFEVRAKDRQVLYLTTLSKLHGTAFELDQLIATASLPLLRLWYRQLQVDITMGLTDDLEVDKVLATILDSATPAVRNMVCMAKAFAKTNDLLNAYSGYLNAVSWVCLCIAFLKEECDDALQTIPLDVCTFSRFLQFVAKSCGRQRHISLGTSRSKGARHGRATLFIEHPTNPHRNLAQCLRQSPAKKTAEACERAAKQLRGCPNAGTLEETLRGLLGVRKRKADPEKATEQPASLNAKGENVLPVIRFSQTQADVKEEFEALKERLDVAQRSAEEVELKRSQAEEKLAAEQQRLVAVQEELDMHKESAQKLQAEFDAQKESLQTAHRSTDETDKKRTVAEEQLAAEQQKLQTVQAELDAQKESLKEAQRNAHELEVKRSQAEAQLATQQQRLQSAVDECEIWKQQATASKDGSQESVKKLQETLLADLQAERQRSATLQQEIALQSSKQAMEAAAMQQLQDELQRQKAAEVTMRATMQTLQAELQQEKAAVQQEVAIRTASKAADASATRNLQEELERRQAAEATLRTTMLNLQEELAQERARAAEAASKYAAVSKVREAALQEVDTVESQTRNLREEMEVQLLEERQKAKELEAKYEALRDAHETAVRVFAESVNAKEEASARMPPAEGSIAAQALQVAIQEALGKEKAVREGLLKDQERLEETTKSLREQMQKVHTVASELEAKVQQSKSRLDAAEGERRAVVQTVVSEDATHADQALRRQIESARQVELQLESRASAAKASLEEERRRVEQLKLEYTNLLQGQQDTVQASQKHLETKLEELGCQMREMRSTLESGRITSNQDDLAKQLAQVSAVNAKLETAVAREAKSLGPTRPSPSPLKAAPSEDVRVAKSPKRSGMQEAPLLKRGREPRVREFDGKMWARTDDAVLTGQRVRHLMLESLAARQQTRMYKEMIQEFDASEVGQKAKLSSAKAALQSLNSSLRGQVEQARRELEQLEKARQAGPVPPAPRNLVPNRSQHR
ncbi:unnamed protein product [Symbiodinium sp. KB8]|nr:unnamed protein product [Symbiodinium sp. KB8]